MPFPVFGNENDVALYHYALLNDTVVIAMINLTIEQRKDNIQFGTVTLML